jgi:beta-glucosidase
VQNVDQITMDSAASTNDYAHGYQVNLSTDGVNWGSPVATGAGTAALVTVGFTPANARYIRVTQTGSSSSWWSIAEFNAYTNGSVITGPTLLPRTGWVASASVSSTTDVPSRMLDGNTATRWSTGTPMVNGQTVTVDMGTAQSVRRITMDSAASTNDYAHGYQVNLSTDGVNWGSPVATGAGTAALVTVDFAATNARYIRVTQTGSSSSWWSIAEFNAYS